MGAKSVLCPAALGKNMTASKQEKPFERNGLFHFRQVVHRVPQALGRSAGFWREAAFFMSFSRLDGLLFAGGFTVFSGGPFFYAFALEICRETTLTKAVFFRYNIPEQKSGRRRFPCGAGVPKPEKIFTLLYKPESDFRCDKKA